MKKLIWFLSIFLYSFSCDPYDSSVDPTEALTSFNWSDVYRDHSGNYVEHIIYFDFNGRGGEYITDRTTGYTTSYSFNWYWEFNYSQIRLDYGDGELLFTNVYVTYTSLTGNLDGLSVHFTPY